MSPVDIEAAARALADDAPPLTSEQRAQLRITLTAESIEAAA